MGKTYNSGSILSNWNGVDLAKGYQSMSIEASGDLKAHKMDAQGRRTTSILADRSATFSVTYDQSAETCALLDNIISAEQIVNDAVAVPYTGQIIFNDPLGSTGSFVALGASITSGVGESWEKEVGERTFTFHCEALLRGDPEVIMGSLANYLI
ncbi:hypothetical protein KUA24_52 [Vibrio phage HNL01]|nr:hypothetical protein KUA24_52 [Vibrio phage HNL01]